MPASVDAAPPEQRIVEAAAVLPEIGGVTGWAGLRWAGGAWFSGRDASGSPAEVELATCYEDVRSQPGFVVRQERLPPAELVDHDGLRMTLPVRSLFFCLRHARTLAEAVTMADLAAFSDLVSTAEAWEYALAHPGWTGVPQARAALLLSDENSWSPPETSLRLLWTLGAGLLGPLTNCPVFDLHGRHIGTPDVLDPESGTAGEYDGKLHLHGRQRAQDERRADRFRDHGLEPVVVTAADLAQPDLVVRRILAARSRALARGSSARSWTVEAPSWWRPTRTVEQRRRLVLEGGGHLLRHRRRAA
ncbi:hypothetical protein SAMN04488570_3279 [Nocardioides scoriae]|uniref:DUF559 domain-containing protein n=1 Tax=Nocardioides scoriae TaxID=642780 RepID=A0A1H1WUV7_9ACTN|nr:hypothetical protein SAMN04488570_3279 [Nocardioides scoriae]